MLAQVELVSLASELVGEHSAAMARWRLYAYQVGEIEFSEEIDRAIDLAVSGDLKRFYCVEE